MTSTNIDYDLLNELTVILEDEFPKIIETFIESTTDLLRILSAALKEKDTKLFILKIHSLKGSCGNIGATYLAELCSVNETLAKSGRINDVDPSLEEVSKEFEKVKTVLHAFLPL